MKIWVNGTFDIIHRGHVEMIQYASTLGELRVGLDFDERVKELKGDTRPFNLWYDRAYVIQNLKGVDSVVGFGSQDELEKEILKWGANIIVVGEEYRNKKVVGSHLVDGVIFFSKVKDFSTTKILKDK